MLIAARNAIAGGKKRLPYDAEVEYLESDRSSLVDTGIDLFDSTDFDFHLKFQVLALYDYVTLWAESTDSAESWIYSNGLCAVRIQNIRVTPQYRINIGSVIDYKITGRNNDNIFIDINGTTQTLNVIWNPVANMMLFGGYGNTGGQWRFFSLKLSKDGELVRDFIPVRVGQVGYMYDRVSRTLFANQGTGAFIVGPDV